MNKAIHCSIVASACMAAVIVSGCGITRPRPRSGCYPSSTLGSTFVSSDNLGPHSYVYSPAEKNGITYACKAGHIDITHVRIAADHTKYVADKLYKALLRDQEEFSFSLTADWSRHIVRIYYPEYWKQAEKELIARQVSLQLAQHLVFSATTWHEMLTWYGYRTMVVFPEFASAFSWEDIYSNLLGIHIATRALQDTEHTYDQAMTLVLQQKLESLGGQSASFARNAAEEVRGNWFHGNVIVSIEKRNLDIGIYDNHVTPILVPGVCPGVMPKASRIPDPDVSQYGFSIEYRILPRELEKASILKIVYPNGGGKTIEPDIHFALIMAQIRKEAETKYGDLINNDYDPYGIVKGR